MKLLSGAVLFFVLVASNLQAVDQSGKTKIRTTRTKTSRQLVDQRISRRSRRAETRRKIHGRARPKLAKSTSAF